MRSAPMLDFPLDEFEQRLGKLFDTLERTDCAAVLLTNVENLRYYCNFRTSAWNSEFLSPAMLVVARGGGIALVTSPRMKATALATCCLDEADILTFDGFDLGADDFQLQLVVEFGPDRQQPNSVAGTRVYSDPDWCIYADSGPSLHGYVSDMIRIAKLKPPTKPQRELYDIVHGCHEKLIPMVKPGLKIGELAKAQDAYMRAHGVDDICLTMSVSGHGLGQDVHEMPVIQQAYSDWEFKVGTVFAFEPTLIHPEHGQIVLENNYLVTENGCENLTPQLQDIYVPGLS